MFWELEKAIFGPEKDKWWIWGSKTPKPPEMPIKLGKRSQYHNWPRYMECPQIGPKIAIKQGKKRQKDKWYLFRAPTGGGNGRGSKKARAVSQKSHKHDCKQKSSHCKQEASDCKQKSCIHVFPQMYRDTGPSREYDITVLVKGRPKSAQQSRGSTVSARSVFRRVKVPPPLKYSRKQR